MKHKIHRHLAFALCILFIAANSLGVEKTAIKSPSAFLPVDVYEFEPVIDGVKVTHDFIIQNKGTTPLQIEKVRTSCGCTTVSYTREIPPGGKGKITVMINTKGYGGRRIKKKIIAQTNDLNHPSLYLTVGGNVDKFADIIPHSVMLIGPAGIQIKTEVTILPQEKYRFKIVGSSARQGENIDFKVEEIKGSRGKVYLLTVENLKREKGRYYDTIILKTDSKIQPEIKINVFGNIQDTY
jgi:hypothetical protein